MGQASSTEASDAAGEEQAAGGVTLAPELQADIVRDFRTTALQDEWNKFGTRVIHRRNERLQRLQESAAQGQQARKAQAAMRQPQEAAVEEKTDAMRAKFQDLVVELEYDANQLLAKHTVKDDLDEANVEKESKPLPCLGQRAHWIDCQKKYAVDPRPCNFYVRALEKCVQDTIGKGIETDSQ